MVPSKIPYQSRHWHSNVNAEMQSLSWVTPSKDFFCETTHASSFTLQRFLANPLGFYRFGCDPPGPTLRTFAPLPKPPCPETGGEVFIGRYPF